MSHTALRIERDDAIAHVILTGPGKGNAMGPRTWTDLPAAFDELESDASVRAVVVSGSGEHFSYGLDVRASLADFDVATDGGANARSGLLAHIETLQRAFTRVANSPLPVIAAISGWCIGAGVELACACDVRYAQVGAKFSLREVQLAIVADLGGLQRLPGIVGEGHARELALTGMNIDAERAERIGLVNAVVPEVLAHAFEVARGIAAHSPLTLRGIKANMNAQQGKTIAEGLRDVALWNAAFLQSADFRAALDAFAQR